MASSGRRFSNSNPGARVTITLVRDGFNQPWGFRLAGGADIGTPLTVQRALAGTPSEGELKPGDVITKIGDRDARHLSHNDAQHLFKNAGNNITLQVQRGDQTKAPSSSAPLSPPHVLSKPPHAQGAVVTNGAPLSPPTPVPVNSPLQVQTAHAPPTSTELFSPVSVVPARGPNSLQALTSPTPQQQPLPNNDNFTKTLKSPVQNLPVTTFPPPLPGLSSDGRGPFGVNSAHYNELAAPECVDMQPYRTTPLVLPGAKVKREVPTTSYLQHHPNPAMRAGPQHYDPNLEVLMKQKAFSKQFNSPIGLYSEQNISESVQAQTGVTPYKGKKTLYYDPAKSETFKALKDAELGDTVTEVPEPIQTKVFTPQKHIQHPLNHRPQKPKSPQPPPENLLGDDKIHQSYSFRRLMNEVLGESEF
ncbi:PDZ and LIM domain protein 7 isoform X8 [Cloeon dipterum]|uniref:PDZ and LIM domain protein 7 isoform X8 n=1 Tax=Cloeon dipterum TaxID=197152 RepID=UPI00321FDD1D